MSQANPLRLQALLNSFVKDYVADTSKEDSQVATHLFALTVKSANHSGSSPLLSAREVVARHLKRKVQEMRSNDSSGQAELAQAQDLQAERLRKLSRELMGVGKDQMMESVDDLRAAKKLCRLLGLPHGTLAEWERSRRAKCKQSKTPPARTTLRKRRSPKVRAAAAGPGRSRFAAEVGRAGGGVAAVAAEEAGSTAGQAPRGAQLAPKQLFQGEAAQPPANAGLADSSEPQHGSPGCDSSTAGLSQASKRRKEVAMAVPAGQGSGIGSTPAWLPSPPGGGLHTRKPRKQRAPTAAASAEGTAAPWWDSLDHVQQPASPRDRVASVAASSPLPAAATSAGLQIAAPIDSEGEILTPTLDAEGSCGRADGTALPSAGAQAAASVAAGSGGSSRSHALKGPGPRHSGELAEALLLMLDRDSRSSGCTQALPPPAALSLVEAAPEGPSPLERIIQLISSAQGAAQPLALGAHHPFPPSPPPFMFGAPAGSGGSSYVQWEASAAADPEIAAGQALELHPAPNMCRLLASPSPPRPGLLLPLPAAAQQLEGGGIVGAGNLGRHPRHVSSSNCPVPHSSAREDWGGNADDGDTLELDVGHGVVMVGKAALQRHCNRMAPSTLNAAVSLGRLSLHRSLQLLPSSFAASGLPAVT